jgi:hypothetical protein
MMSHRMRQVSRLDATLIIVMFLIFAMILMFIPFN